MNPFKYGEVVQGEYFCRRPELEKSLLENMKSGQNLVIQGDRRIGKTSLIKMIINESFKNALMVDFRGVKDERDLIGRLQAALNRVEKSKLKRILSQLGNFSGSFSVGPFEVEMKRDFNQKEASIRSFLELAQALRGKSSCVVFFDEFQDILSIEDSETIIAVLRSEIQHMSKISFLFAGSSRNEMFKIFQSPSSAFYQGAKVFDIGSVEPEYFIPFLNEKFMLNRLRATQGFWNEIFAITDISGDVQQLCSAVWDVTPKNTQLTEESVHKGLKRIFATEGRVHEYLFNQLTALQLRVVKVLALHDELSPTTQEFIDLAEAKSASSVVKALVAAERLDIVYRKERSKYRFVSPFFKVWLKSQLSY